jgi:cell division protein FtsZ
MLDRNTKMVLSLQGWVVVPVQVPPVISASKEKFLLCIVTLPFLFEGKVRQEQAKIGIEKLRKQVDSLVINNNKLREYTEILVLKLDFQKRMKFCNRLRGIAEVITHHYTQNIDLRDANSFV